MSVLIASRLITLLRKVPRKSGHTNSPVKNNVTKLQGVRIYDRGIWKGFSQIISQEGGGGDKLEANIAYTLSDRRYIT